MLCTDTKHPFDYAKFAHFEKENQLMIDDAFQRLARQNATYSQNEWSSVSYILSTMQKRPAQSSVGYGVCTGSAAL